MDGPQRFQRTLVWLARGSVRSASPDRPTAEDTLGLARAVLAWLQGAVPQTTFPLADRWPPTPSVLELADQHGVTALAYRAASQMAEAVPTELRCALQVRMIQLTARNLLLAAQLEEIIAAAEQAAVPLTPFKGPALAVQAYGDLADRQSVDLDFILPHASLTRAAAMLEALGYRPWRPGRLAARWLVPGEYLFAASAKPFHLELHTERTLRHFPRRVPLVSLLERRQQVFLLERRVPVFSREDTLVLLAVHGAKDFWRRLLWVADVAALAADPQLDWAATFERAGQWGCRTMVHLALWLAVHLCGLCLPPPLAAEIAGNRSVRSCATQLLAALRPAAPAFPGGLSYRWRLADGLWQKFRYTARLATLHLWESGGPVSRALEQPQAPDSGTRPRRQA